jgi:hypothetical protein
VYFSDGAASRYKNCVYLCHHEDDYGVHAEWYFFAISHMKDVHDSMGGTTKHLAMRMFSETLK